jgi:hypothetical protein
MSGAPIHLPARHVINIALGVRWCLYRPPGDDRQARWISG